MQIHQILTAMTMRPEQTVHDVNHLLKVWGWARTIAQAEQVSPVLQETIELAAIVHDIACPQLRARLGSAPGYLQELEGPELVEDFLKTQRVNETVTKRVLWLVSHHHTLSPVEGIDHQILLEADFLVNADESGCDKETIRSFGKDNFRTAAGRKLLQNIYEVTL